LGKQKNVEALIGAGNSKVRRTESSYFKKEKKIGAQTWVDEKNSSSGFSRRQEN
jgi:hypothetical protein